MVELFLTFFCIAVFIGLVALIMFLLEKLSKKVGSKVIYISIVFVIPMTIGLAIVAASFDELKWYEIIYIPFAGSAFILAACLMLAIQFNPEILCSPFKYVWKFFNKK